jgi:squalene cyclase
MAKSIKSIESLGFFVNDDDPNADALMRIINCLGVKDVSVAPTSGPCVLWIRQKKSYTLQYIGQTQIVNAVNAYLK